MKQKLSLLKISKEEAKEVTGGVDWSWCLYKNCHGDQLLYAELNRWARAGAFPCNEIP